MKICTIIGVARKISTYAVEAQRRGAILDLRIKAIMRAMMKPKKTVKKESMMVHAVPSRNICQYLNVLIKPFNESNGLSPFVTHIPGRVILRGYVC